MISTFNQKAVGSWQGIREFERMFGFVLGFFIVPEVWPRWRWPKNGMRKRKVRLDDDRRTQQIAVAAWASNTRSFRQSLGVQAGSIVVRKSKSDGNLELLPVRVTASRPNFSSEVLAAASRDQFKKTRTPAARSSETASMVFSSPRVLQSQVETNRAVSTIAKLA